MSYQDEKWYKFTAFNSQAQYGYGSLKEANDYCEWLNTNKEKNFYMFVTMTKEQIQQLNLDNGDLGFNLNDALATLEE